MAGWNSYISQNTLSDTGSLIAGSPLKLSKLSYNYTNTCTAWLPPAACLQGSGSTQSYRAMNPGVTFPKRLSCISRGACLCYESDC